MKQAVKFTFDTYFGERPSTSDRIEEVEAPRITEAEVEAARRAAYAEGFAAGEREAAARRDDALVSAMSQLAESTGALLAALDTQLILTRKEAVMTAMETARKLAPALIATRPEAEIEAVLRNCLAHLNREPHILLRVSPSLVDRLKDTVDRMAMERGLSGRIILLGEPDMKEGDCVVEWADGGVARDRAAIENEITAVVSRYIETLGASGSDENRLAMPEPAPAAGAASRNE